MGQVAGIEVGAVIGPDDVLTLKRLPGETFGPSAGALGGPAKSLPWNAAAARLGVVLVCWCRTFEDSTAGGDQGQEIAEQGFHGVGVVVMACYLGVAT